MIRTHVKHYLAFFVVGLRDFDLKNAFRRSCLASRRSTDRFARRKLAFFFIAFLVFTT